ncbi:MarR family winged helix-turn-helix transcriptional regulator [Azospirillum sp.]|uniref:MarR family winged helix-turn-helix transcriptional regulator n=1 Tax=Azospirillum sp. TaxID=34012 RepID=UPI003D7157A3
MPTEDLLTDDACRTLAQRPGFLIRRLHQIHVALFMEECAEFKITPVQYSVLTVLASKPDLDQVSLGAQIGMDRTTMTGVLTRLVQRGLLVRRPGLADRRVKLVSITEAGRALLRHIDGSAGRAHDRTVAPLSDEDRSVFLRCLANLVEANNDYGRAPLHLP